MSDAAAASSTAADFLSQLSAEGTQVTWKQRQVSGTDTYGQPKVTFNPSTITAIIRLLRPMEVRLVEPGFHLQHYLWLHYSPSVNIQILDRIAYQSVDYEVRIAIPFMLAGVAVYGQALLRALLPSSMLQG